MVTEARPTHPLVRRLAALVALSRPSVWITSLLPFCLGYVLATHRFLPASCTPLSGDCFADIRPLATGILLMGPLAWLAILAINDAADLPGDLHNPRKVGKPVASGRMSANNATKLAYVAGAVALAVAMTIGFPITVMILLWLALGWAYSVPPLRLKTRPGWDVATNAVAVGGLALVAGWSVAQPIVDFPWIMVVEGLLVGTALYLPTTLADYDADVASGYTTSGVRLGRARTHYIGLGAMAASCIIAIVLAASDYVIPHRMLGVQIVAAPILIGAYHLLLSKAHGPKAVVRASVVITLMFTAVNVVFGVMYVGWI